VSNEERNQLREFVERLLDIFSAQLANLEHAADPELMANVLIEYVSGPDFWTAEMKAGMRTAVLPAVKQWYARGPV
jgi:hypothetical protein